MGDEGESAVFLYPMFNTVRAVKVNSEETGDVGHAVQHFCRRGEAIGIEMFDRLSNRVSAVTLTIEH
jgi:hypothetical protein